MHASRLSAKFNPAVALVLIFGIAVIAVFTFMVMTDDPASVDGAGVDEESLSVEAAGASAGASEEASEEQQRVKLPVTSDTEGAGAKASAGPERLSGVVLDESGAPVAGAELRAVRTKGFDRWMHPFDYRVHRTVSGADGGFTFKGIPTGNYAVSAVWNHLAGRLDAFAALHERHPDGRRKTYEVILRPAGTIEGRVVTEAGEPVAGAVVLPVSMNASFTDTDAEGRFTLDRIMAGQHTLLVLSRGYAPKSERRIITGRRDVELVVDEGGSISGRVLFNGRPRSGVRVAAEGGMAHHLLTREAVSDEEGRYRLERMESGTYHLRVVSDKLAAADRANVELLPKENQEHMDFVLVETGGLAGCVVDGTTGQPVGDAWVIAFPTSASARYYPFGDAAPHFSQPFHLHHVRTDAKGGYRFPCLAPTDYRIGVRTTGGLASMLWEGGRIVQVVPGERIEGVDFSLARGTEVEVKVRTESGTPVECAEINLHEERAAPEFSGIRLHAPGEELGGGTYRLAGLGPATYRIGAIKWPLEDKWKSLTISEGESSSSLEIVLDDGRTLIGKVVDPDGRGIAGAHINLSNHCRAITDEKGAFRINDAPNRFYWVQVIAEGYHQSYQNDLKVNDGEEVMLTLEPVGKGHFLSGTLVNDLGEPLAGVKVYARQQKNPINITRSCLSDEAGRFHMDGLAKAPAEISVTTGQGSLDPECEQVEVDRKALKLVVNRFARVKGRVQSADGEPVPAFTVGIEEKKQRFGGRKKSAESFYDESFELCNIPSGEVTLVAVAPDGREGLSEALTLAPGEARDGVVIKLMERCSISGKVMSMATSEPVEGAGIHLDKPGERDRIYFFMPDTRPKATTGEDGTFYIKNLEPGSVVVRASHKDYMDAKLRDVQLVTGETTGGLALYLEKGGCISGCVRMEGVPLPGVRVDAWGENRNRSEDMTDKNGIYRLKNLAAGTYRLTARTGDWDEEQLRVTSSVELAKGGDVIHDIHLAQGGTLAGTTFVSGKPQRQVRVQLSPMNRDDDSRQSGSTESGSNGAYEIKGLPPGKYRLHAYYHSGPDGLNKSEEVEIIEGVTRFDIHLGAEGTGMISGHVYENDMPMPGEDVNCSVGGMSQRKETDMNGFFKFTELPAGRVSLSVNRYDWETGFNMHTRKSLELAEGQAAETEIRLKTGTGVITGKVLCNGEPVEEAHINIVVTQGASGVHQTLFVQSMDGVYRAENLPAGRCRVSLSRPWPMNHSVEVADGRESVADFSYEVGDAAIEGTVTLPEKKKAYPYVYLLLGGAEIFRIGEGFKPLNFSDGAYATLYANREGKIRRRGSLPAKTFDVAAVLVEEQVVTALDVQRVTLRDGETTQVKFDLSGKAE